MKTFKQILTISLLTIIFLMAFHVVAEAANNFTAPTIYKPELIPGPETAAVANEGSRNILLNKFLPNLAVRIIGLIGVAALISIIVGGLRYVTAYGNDEAIEKAKTQILYSIVGFIVAILSYTIVSIVINTQFSDNTNTGPAQGPPAPQQNQP